MSEIAPASQRQKGEGIHDDLQLLVMGEAREGIFARESKILCSPRNERSGLARLRLPF
jgi:hypothetical protein